ncbi:hypothetical protein GALL_339870 [mine drainage metagenome]|uniref:Uncharacterized protein n=1 Tax=mine drainage metagenome TaxID=410659 RepID=A0A1J5QL61_9ZZZZ
MQAVGVLRGVDQLEDPLGVDPARKRELHDVPRAARIRVELLHGGLDVGLARIRGEVDADRGDPDLGAVPVLARDVRAAPGVVAHQDRAETRHDAAGSQRGDPLSQLRLDRGGGRRPVEDPSRHCCSPA